MSTHYRVVFCTCPDSDTAIELAKGLVEAHLAACVNLLPGIQSVYSWKRQLQIDHEVLMVIKTRRDQLNDMEQFILAHHPYELPEIVAVSIDHGNQDYLEWVSTWLDSSD